jgi:hypothetical protein
MSNGSIYAPYTEIDEAKAIEACLEIYKLTGKPALLVTTWKVTK